MPSGLTQLSSGYLEVQNSQQVCNLPRQLSDVDLKPLLIWGGAHTAYPWSYRSQAGSCRLLAIARVFAAAGRLPSLKTLCIMNADLPSLIVRSNELNASPTCRLLVQLQCRTIHFPTASQLVELISALPVLRTLQTQHTLCKEDSYISRRMPRCVSEGNLRQMIVEDHHDAALLDAISELARNARLLTLKIGICDWEEVARWGRLCQSLEEFGLRCRPRDMMPTAQAGYFCEHHTE